MVSPAGAQSTENQCQSLHIQSASEEKECNPWDFEYSHPNHKQGIRGLTPGMETFALVVRFSSTPMFINISC